MRIGALHSMRIGDLTEVSYQGEKSNSTLIYQGGKSDTVALYQGEKSPLMGIYQSLKTYKIQVYARTRDRYYTFTTPEAAKAIDEYLGYRTRNGEVLKDESPLFRKGFNKADQFTINDPKFLSAGGVTRCFDELIKRSGVKSNQVMRSHAFRKGFKSICEQSGMKSINVEMLLGHDIGVSGHYYRPNEADLLKDYMSHAADALTIDPTKRLQQKVQDLEGRQAQEIEQLKTQLQGIKKNKQEHKIFQVRTWPEALCCDLLGSVLNLTYLTSSTIIL
jgi:hypothetical protein